MDQASRYHEAYYLSLLSPFLCCDTISLGTDIYTVSKMLTHKNVSTTQIYADLVNSKKRETAEKISLK